jgi:nitronate monooxygenase
MSWLDSVQSRLSLPVIASPMFIVSNPRLVAAECKAGIVGSFPALNARPAELLDEWLTQLKAELATHDAAHPERPAAPFAVNQICHRSNDRLMRDMETCVKHQVPIIITSLQVSAELVAAAHSYGGVVFHDVTSIRHAEKAIEAGVDGLILVCAGAGGHAGTLSPFALLPEIRRIFQGPIALAGAIANGQSILAAQALGADFAYMGTRFIATQEANAVDAYKQMLVDTRAEDIVYSSSPVCRATTSSPASPPPAWTRTTCPAPTRARWISARAATAPPRPGATSGAPARAWAPSTACPAWPRWWTSSRPSTARPARTSPAGPPASAPDAQEKPARAVGAGGRVSPGSGPHSSLPPMPNRLSRLVNRLNSET